MTLDQLYLVLLVAGAVVIASVGAARFASRFGMPLLLAFLAVGLLLGEDGIGLGFDNAQLAQSLGTAALAVILVEGGLTTDWRLVRPATLPAVLLATVGVGISTAVTALGAYLLLGLPWQLGLLLGAIVSSTDAAAVFSVLRNLPLPSRLSGVLEAESGFNDAPTVILVLALSAGPLTAETPLRLAGALLFELAGGTVVGLLVGALGAYLLRRLSLPASGLYPIAAMTCGIVAFSAAGALHFSGFIAAFLAGVVLGNSGLPRRNAVNAFAEGLAWVAQIGLFVMLGLLASPHELPGALLPALLIGTVLLLVARPVSVFASLLPFRMPWRQQALLSWAGLRGAVPIVLATIPLVADVPGSGYLFNLVFVLVVVFTLVQGPTLPPLTRLLRVATGPARDVAVESAPLDAIAADLLHVRLEPGSRLHGVEIFELRLPETAAVALVVREGRSFVPERTTRLRMGDELLITTAARVRPAVEKRLRAVSRSGRLAQWRGDYGADE